MENAGEDLRARRWPKARDRYGEALQAWGEPRRKAARSPRRPRRKRGGRPPQRKRCKADDGDRRGARRARAAPALARAREMIGAAAASLPDLEQAQTGLEALRDDVPASCRRRAARDGQARWSSASSPCGRPRSRATRNRAG